MFFKFSKKNNKGFTLLELLVVISLIITFSALILPRYKKGEQLFAMQRSAHKLAQDIGRAREMAISAKEFKEEIPKGGWGVYLTPATSTYILFADCNENKKYDDKWETMEEIFLERGVEVSEIFPIEHSALTIIFKGPDPVVFINGKKNIASAFTIIAINGFSRTVKVNKAGLIEIE